MNENEYIYCGFWRRSIASMLDGSLILMPLTLSLLMVLAFATSSPWETVSKMVLVTSIFIRSFYIPLFESSALQSTIGCKLMKMRIMNVDGTRVTFLKSFIRVIVCSLINITFVLAIVSLFCVVFTKEKKFLHDMICKTRMVRR